jgi:hypothetical protein
VNLRKDHYQEPHRKGPRPVGAGRPSSFTLLNGLPGTRGSPHLNPLRTCPTLLPPAPRWGEEQQPKLFVNKQTSELQKQKKVKTFNNGSLGSHIDEERSEMR